VKQNAPRPADPFKRDRKNGGVKKVPLYMNSAQGSHS
jgi:hypothetical protein